MNDVRDDLPLVSLIVPAYNAERYLVPCLESLARQTYRRLEVLIVDDGSQDATASIARRFAEHDARFTLYAQENKGVSAARNRALSCLTGSYVMFVDSDDWVEPGYVAAMVAAAEATGAELVISAYGEYDDQTGQERIVRLANYPERTTPEVIADEKTLYGGFCWNKLIRRERITHPYHEELFFYENLVFLLENTDDATLRAVVHEPLYHYRVHADSAVHGRAYQPRWLTVLPAVERALGLVPPSLTSFYQYLYINRVCWLKRSARRAGVRLELPREDRRARELCKEVVRARDLPLSLKVKAPLLCHAPFVYDLWLGRLT